MKSLFKVWMLVAAMTAFGMTMYAQNQNGDKKRLTREELAEKQAKHIADVMAMDESVAKRFVETYCQSQKEVWALGPRMGKGTQQKNSSETDGETEQELKARFEHSQKILDIRQKYYKKYSEFLTQKQNKRVYELERQMMNRLAKQKGKGGRTEGKRQ